MKNKRLSLLAAVMLCIFLLTGCAATQQPVQDEEIAAEMVSRAEAVINEITGADEAKLEQMLEHYGLNGIEPDRAMLSGLQSWTNNKGELTGEMTLRGIETIDSLANNTYVAVGDLGFESRDCEFRMVFNRQMETKSMTFNPVYTFGQKMQKAGMNTIAGIGTVFIMLALISGIIYCFKYIHAWDEKRTAAKKAPAPAAPAQPVVRAVPEPEEEEEDLTDDLELVAVITAAIAASEEVNPDGLVVRSIRRSAGAKWRRA